LAKLAKDLKNSGRTNVFYDLVKSKTWTHIASKFAQHEQHQQFDCWWLPYTCVCVYIYIYVYIKRERDRVRERGRERESESKMERDRTILQAV